MPGAVVYFQSIHQKFNMHTYSPLCAMAAAKSSLLKPACGNGMSCSFYKVSCSFCMTPLFLVCHLLEGVAVVPPWSMPRGGASRMVSNRMSD